MRRTVLILSLVAGVAGRGAAELPIAIPITDLPATNLPPGFVVPEPTRGARTNGAPVATEPVKPKPVVEPIINYGNRDWKVVPASGPTVDEVVLRNDDRCEGKLGAWDGTTVRWDYAGAVAPIRWQCAGIAALKLAAPPAVAAVPVPRWIVRLTNGNLLTGEALTLDGAQVELTTSYAGRLRLPRPMVESVRQDLATAKWRALHWLPGWDRVNFGRQEDNLQEQRWLYRDVDLPDSVAVELLVPVTQQMNLNLQFYTGPPAQLYHQPCYTVSLNGTYLSVASQGGRMGGGDNQPLQFRPARGRTVVDLAILLNRNTGRVVVLVDGEVKRTAQLGPLPDGAGRGVIVSGGQPGQELPPWLLVTPLAEDGQLASAKAETDALQFANGDVLDGALETIGPEKFVVNGQLGRVELPLERLVLGSLARARRAEPRRREGDLAIELRGGGRLTAVLQELTDTRLMLDSELFGKVAIAREIVSELRWGLYDPPPQPAAPRFDQRLLPWEPGTLELTGNRRLHGSLLGFADGAVRWQHPHAAEPILFRQENVVRATLAPRRLNQNPPATVVTLTNGDRLTGALLAVDQPTLQLRPNYMPSLSLPRRGVESIRPGEPPEGVLDVPGSPTWNYAGKSAGITVTNHHVNWTNRGAGEFFPRQGALPARTCLQFEVVDEGPSRNVTAFIYGRQSANGHVDAYYLNLAETQLFLADPRAGGGNGQSVALPRPSASRSIAVTWLIDREQRAMWVLLEGQLAAQWQNRGTIQTGNLLSFLSQSSGPTQLRRVILSDWRGPIAALTNAVSPAADSLLLHDMTRQTGTLTSLQAGQLHFASATGTVILGLGRVAQITFNKDGREQPRRRDGDIRVYLPDGDQLTLSGARCDSNGLIGTGAAGSVALPANAIQRVVFRPYDPPPKPANNRYSY